MENNELDFKFFKKLIERYLDGITTMEELRLLVNYYESFQKENEWVEALGPESVIKERMLRNILEAIKVEDDEKEPTKVFSLLRNNNFKYAAAALLVLFIALTFIIRDNNSTTEINNLVELTNDIEIGTNKATLTREDGSNIILEKGEEYIADNIESNGEELIYSQNTTTAPEVAYNYLTIPRGGEFLIKLSDGTQVWLNSESKLKYPVAFTEGNTRQVELLYGEAYFDVSPSTEHQGSKFVVTNNNQYIEVVGTEFNLKAYSNEQNTITTLVHGKVNVIYKGEKHVLTPNQQSILNRNTNSLSIKTVDVFYETSWKDGMFSFQDKSLKEIMDVMSRWYDFEVIFKNNKVQDEEFIGVLGREDNIEILLNNLKDYGTIKSFEIDGKTITIE